MAKKLNNTVHSLRKTTLFPAISHLLDNTITFDQGDLLKLSGGLIQRMTAETDGNLFVGIAAQTIVLGKAKSPYTSDVDAAIAPTEMEGPHYGVTAKLALKAGDTFAPGDEVYWQGDREVAVAGTKSIGIYVGASITAVAGDEGEVLIGERLVGDVLKF